MGKASPPLLDRGREFRDTFSMNPLTLLFALAFLVSVDMRILTPVLPSISLSLGSPPGSWGWP